jgi:FKBP-type peptidyl-prolyl cis-trans isomerase
VRTTIALTAAAALLMTLTACSTSAPSGHCEPQESSGNASATVKADGAFADDPEATFPTPLVPEGVQVSTLDVGDGETIYPGQYATVAMTFLDGTTGESLGESYDETAPIVIRAGEGASKIGFAVECQTVGSRVVVSMAGEDLWGMGNVNDTNVAADLSMVMVIDIRSVLLGKAHGVDQLPAQGLPAVVTAPDGTPGLTVPALSAPTSVQVSVLKKADGAAVEAGDIVYLHLLRVDWNDPDSFKSTWENFGNPSPFALVDYDPATGIGVPSAIVDALVGQTVGSQVMVVLPPAYGFAESALPEGVEVGDTLVYVFDILGTNNAAK